jgi:ribonucleases P/MRP protein subunit RPP40
VKTEDKKVLTDLYKTLVRPHLEYCVPSWSPYYQKDKAMLERVQHRFTRLFSDLRQLDYPSRLRHLNLWSLEEHRHRADLIEVYKTLQGQSHIPPETLLTVSVDSSTHGHSLKLVKHHCKRDRRLQFFSERIVNRWNLLDQAAVSSDSLNSFERHLEILRKSYKKGLFID